MDATVALLNVKGLDLCLWMHTARDPPQGEWEAGVALVATVLKRNGGDVAKFRTLVVSDGGAPNGIQRGQLFADLFQSKPHKISVITISLHNPIKRGIATAISWINPGFRAFKPTQTSDALGHLDLGDQLPTLWPHLERLQLGFGAPIVTLREMARLQPAGGPTVRDP